MSGVAQQLARLLQSARKKYPADRFVGIRHDSTEPLPPEIQIDGEPWRVHRVRSPLEARLALVDAGAVGRALLVAPLHGEDLGPEVTSRLAKQKLLDLQPWQLVRDEFKARLLDSRVVKEGAWLARELLAAVPAGGYPPAPSGIFDLDTAWAALWPRLGLGGPRPGVGALLAASANGGFGESWLALATDFRSALARRLETTLGAVGKQIAAAVENGHGDELVPIGLVLDLILAEGVAGQPRELIVRTRMERLGLHIEEPMVLAPWAVEAVRWVRGALQGDESSRRGAGGVLERAEQLIEQLGARDLAEASAVLRCGLEARTARLAEVLVSGLGPGTFDLGQAERAYSRFREHFLTQFDPALEVRRVRAEDALRLARWLANPASELDSLGAHAERYRSQGAYVDRARKTIARGEGDRELAPVYAALAEAVAQRREAENRAFAERLARVAAGSEGAGDILHIEDVLERVVAPLAKRINVLLVVMDGMSEAIAEELVEDLQRLSRLQRMSPEQQERLHPVIGLLPSVTEVCRTSLFCGTRKVGGQEEELEGFELLSTKHSWRGRVGSKRLLFHKAELTGPHQSIAPEVEEALRSSAKVVAVVVNAVDDHLAKGDQLRPDWKLERVPVLQELVSRAEDAGRAIVLTADHGHVVDAGATRKVGSSSTEGRWRPVGGATEEGELELRGERVLLPRPGGPCVLPWSERLRYSNPHAGYHGGAAPQEVVTPLVVLVPEANCDDLEGWKPEVHDLPWWWVGSLPVTAAPVPVKRPVAAPPTRKPGRKIELTEALFPEAVPAVPMPALPAGPPWLAKLFASPVWSEQRELAGRTPPDNEQVREVLAALAVAGGKLTLEALRNRTRFTPLRLRGLLTVMERMLNVDGYAVLEVNHGAGEVQLAEKLLFTQFGLGEGAP